MARRIMMTNKLSQRRGLLEAFFQRCDFQIGI